MKIVVRLKTEEKVVKIRIIESSGLIEYVHCTKSSIVYKIYIFFKFTVQFISWGINIFK